LNWREIHRYEWFGEGQTTFSPIVALNQGRTLYFYSNHEGRLGLYSLDLVDGGGFHQEFLHDEVDIDWFDFSRTEDKPLSVAYTVDIPDFHF
ncbi:hypothetical protein DF186_15700, partial [Enterococcus hirae]